MERPLAGKRIIGPLGSRFTVETSSEPNTSNTRTEMVLESYLEYLSNKYSVEPPDVRVWDSSEWVQIVIDPQTVKANYDNSRGQVNFRADDIRFIYAVHEFAHHLAHTSDDVDLVLEELAEDNVQNPDVLEGMNEMQAEKLADEIAEERKVRLNWNQLVADSIGVPKVDL